jgi:myo-inositol-1(or 4)-monophosphatase
MQRYEVNLPYKFRMLGAAAYDFCIVARGAAIGAFQAIPKIWDIAAGWLVLAESGGVVELHGSGSPFPYLQPGSKPEESFPTVMAVNRKIAGQLQTAIQKKKRIS